VLLEEGDVFEEELFLEVFGPGGDDDAFARKQRRDEVGESLSGTCAGFDYEMLLIFQGAFDGFGHLDLARTELIIGMPFRERTAAREEAARFSRCRFMAIEDLRRHYFDNRWSGETLF
jgi:hypothetical protein